MDHKPAIIIADGFTTNDLHTLDDCNRAFLILSEGIITIEGQINDPEFVASRTPKWKADATTALRFKKVGLRVIEQRRADLKLEFASSWARRFVDVTKTQHPEVFHAVQSSL